jgi:ADP-ribosylglycohydrolase
MTHTGFDRVYGCLIGGAIGDALGATVEGWSYRKIRDEYGKVDHFGAYDNPHARGEPGSITDDSVMCHYLALAIAENEGRITPPEYADTLKKHLDTKRVWVTEELMIRKLAAGMNPWRSGRGTIPTGTAMMAIAPVGIINAANPRQAYQDGYTIASVNQDSVECDAAATVAAGIAQAFAHDATVDSVLETMLDRSPDILFRVLDQSMGLAEEADEIDSFIGKFYDELLDWQWPAVNWERDMYDQGEVFSASSLESLPAAMGILRWYGDDPNEALKWAATFGRDSDTIGALVGYIVGAVHGADRIDETWIDQCTQANQEFFEGFPDDVDVGFETMAGRLLDALERELNLATERQKKLSELLDDQE